MKPSKERLLDAATAKEEALRAFEAAAEAMQRANEAFLDAVVAHELAGCRNPDAELLRLALAAGSTWTGNAASEARNAQERLLRQRAIEMARASASRL